MNKAERHPLKKALWRACDVMRSDDNCNGARDYVEHLTWLLLLKFLDQRESRFGNDVNFDERYRWKNWVRKFIGTQLLQGDTTPSEVCEIELMQFVKSELFPYLATLSGTAEQEVIASVFVGRNPVICNSSRNLRDLIEIIDKFDFCAEDCLQTCAEFYEELLHRLSAEDISSGEFLVPPAVAHSIVQILNPTIGETVYDPSCGSGAFLVEVHKFLQKQPVKSGEMPDHIFLGLERKPIAALIGSMNVVLNGLPRAQIRRQNALESCDSDIPQYFDVVITNPPFGLNASSSKPQGAQGQRRSAEVLYVKHIMDKLRPRDGARCAMIVSDGILFRSGYFEKARKKLTEQFNISLVVSLPSGCFPHTSAKTSIVFFNFPGPTKEILYYEIAVSRSAKKANKKNQLNDDDFAEMHGVWSRWQAYLRKEESRPVLPESSWTVPLDQIRVRNYDLSARPNNLLRRSDSNSSTSELLSQLAADGRELTLSVDRLAKLFDMNGGA